MSWVLVRATAAWEARAPTRPMFRGEKAVTAPETGSRAFRSWSTPMMSPSWLVMGTTSMEVER